MKPSLLVWELRGRTGRPITCVLDAVEHGRCALTVMLGEQVIFAEQYRHRPDAIAQASSLRTDFIGAGWVEVFNCGLTPSTV